MLLPPHSVYMISYAVEPRYSATLTPCPQKAVNRNSLIHTLAIQNKIQYTASFISSRLRILFSNMSIVCCKTSSQEKAILSVIFQIPVPSFPLRPSSSCLGLLYRLPVPLNLSLNKACPKKVPTQDMTKQVRILFFFQIPT